MATALPTVVLVHGAWHTPPVYQTYIDALRARGFTVHSPRLPSCNGELPPNKSLPDDIAHVRDVVLPLVDAGERVIMAMHSYGGAVGTDAVEGLSLTERKAQGHQGGVIHLVYMCAYILPPGGTVYGIVEQAGVAHLWPVFVDNYDDGSTFPKDAADMFLNGPDKEEMFEKVRMHLVRSPMDSFEMETKGTGWLKVPAMYVVTVQDHAVPKIYQDIMLARVKEEGVELRIETYDTNHSIFMTKQKEMVELLIKAAHDERNPQ